MTLETWVIDSPSAVSEVIDGELVVMNLATGNYFSGTGVGATLWSCFERALSREAIVEEVLRQFDVDREQFEDDLEQFAHVLQGHGLIRLGIANGSGAVGQPANIGIQPYAKPELTLYTDMKDLLMLDPIHDVAEEGWPKRPVDKASI